jgi:hypothetical protein
VPEPAWGSTVRRSWVWQGWHGSEASGGPRRGRWRHPGRAWPSSGIVEGSNREGGGHRGDQVPCVGS